MGELKFDARVPGLPDGVVEPAKTAEEHGFDGVWSTETSHNAFLPHPLMAEHTDDVELGTSIALAFTRSPMDLAYIAWDLAAYSGGRFILGLGTQVKGHNVRRFSVDFDWESPGQRLREVIESLRHIWRVWQREDPTLDYEGEYFQFSLMTDYVDPGPIDSPNIPIHIAGFNQYNLRLAGELCEGLQMHPLTTPKYTEDVIIPHVKEGVERGNRSFDDVELAATPLTITGETEEELAQDREATRKKLSFLGSTRTYHDVFEYYGWEEVGPELHEHSIEGRFDEMPDLISDEMLYTFAVEAEVDGLADAIRDEYGDIVDRTNMPIRCGTGL